MRGARGDRRMSPAPPPRAARRPAGTRADAAGADRGARPRRDAARRAARCRATAARRRRRGHRARAAAAVRGRRRRAPHRRGGDRPHRRAARAPARARADADDLARARRLGVDGVRHRRRGSRPTSPRASRSRSGAWRCATPAASALVTFGAGEPRLLPPRGVQARPRRAAPRARGGRRARRRPRPATRWPTRSGASARVARQPGLVVVDLATSATSTTGRAPLGALRAHHAVLAVEIARPARGGGARRRAPRARRPRDRRAGRGRHLARRACASASPRWRPSAATRVARELRRLRVDHVAAEHRRATGCSHLGRRLR